MGYKEWECMNCIEPKKFCTCKNLSESIVTPGSVCETVNIKTAGFNKKVMPEGRKIEVTLKHEVGTFSGEIKDGKFMLDCGGVWEGYWQDRIDKWYLLNN